MADTPIPIPYLQAPATIVNEALDRIGASEEAILGDITDGTRVAETARRSYGQLLRQLLRTAHWGFARKQAKLTLLGDASGNSAAPVIAQVEPPWQYCYGWPLDGVQGRWLPWTPTNVQPHTSTGLPLTTAPGVSPIYPMLTPGRFLVSSSDLYPVEVGSVPWTQMPDLQRTSGLGPTTRKVILTDCCNAHFVYTRLVTTIEEWDGLFREAMVALLAVALAPVAIEDPRERFTQRNNMIAIAKNAIADARVADGNEAGWPQSVDFEASFIRGRNFGPYWSQGSLSGGVGMGGGFGCGWEPFSFGGSVM